MKYICEEAFSGCDALATINLEAVEYLGPEAFLNCISLDFITINDEADVEDDSFKGCTLLEARSSKFNMAIDNYFRKSHQQRITERLTVLNCTKMLLQIEVGKRPQRRRINNEEEVGGGEIVYLKGLLAFKMITAFESWIEIFKFI